MNKNKIPYQEGILNKQLNIHIAYIVVIVVVAVAVYVLAEAYFADEQETEQKQEQAYAQMCEGLEICNIKITEQRIIGDPSENSERALVDIEWDPTKQPANYYLMQYKQSADPEWQNCGVECFVGQANNKVEITLPRATTYDFQVRACSGQDCADKGEWSKPFSFTTE